MTPPMATVAASTMPFQVAPLSRGLHPDHGFRTPLLIAVQFWNH